MLKSKCRKQLLLTSEMPWLSERQSKLLSGTIYHTFREDILPFLPVYVFNNVFSSTTGRPTKDIQSMLGLFIIQALFDMTDIEAVEAYSFNDTFRYALDLPRNECLAERTFYYYRSKLLGEGHAVFETVLKRIAEKINLPFHIQRKDSTLVRTWLKRMSKIELFRTTIKSFLVELKGSHPAIFSKLDGDFIDKFLPKKDGESWFSGDKPSQYAERLVEVAKDVLWLIEQFSCQASVAILPSFALLQRLAKEQIQVHDDKVEVKLDAQFKGSALVNPHDPDARYDGHRKEVGYHVQLTETCSESKDVDNPKIITQIEVNLANSPDVQTVIPGIERLEEAGLKPEILLTDNGYASDDNHQGLKDRGVDHVCPPAGALPDGFGVIDFAINEDGESIKRCPMGKPCLENKVSSAKKATASYFAVDSCRSCPHSHDCPVKITKKKAKLDWAWKRPRLEARRLQFDGDKPVKKLFRQRSGGEVPFSILKNKMGLSRIRRRGHAKTTLMVLFAATALNVLRTHQWLARAAEKTKKALSDAINPAFSIFQDLLRALMKAAPDDQADHTGGSNVQRAAWALAA